MLLVSIGHPSDVTIHEMTVLGQIFLPILYIVEDEELLVSLRRASLLYLVPRNGQIESSILRLLSLSSPLTQVLIVSKSHSTIAG